MKKRYILSFIFILVGILFILQIFNNSVNANPDVYWGSSFEFFGWDNYGSGLDQLNDSNFGVVSVPDGINCLGTASTYCSVYSRDNLTVIPEVPLNVCDNEYAWNLYASGSRRPDISAFNETDFIYCRVVTSPNPDVAYLCVVRYNKSAVGFPFIYLTNNLSADGNYYQDIKVCVLNSTDFAIYHTSGYNTFARVGRYNGTAISWLTSTVTISSSSKTSQYCDMLPINDTDFIVMNDYCLNVCHYNGSGIEIVDTLVIGPDNTGTFGLGIDYFSNTSRFIIVWSNQSTTYYNISIINYNGSVLSKENPDDWAIGPGSSINYYTDCDIVAFNNTDFVVLYQKGSNCNISYLRYVNNTMYMLSEKIFTNSYGTQGVRAINISKNRFVAIWSHSNYLTSIKIGEILNIQPPNNVVSVKQGSNINISWVNDPTQDYTVIIRKNSSFPVNISDGIVIYNDTGTFNLSIFNNSYYYGLWGYNSTVNDYSDNAAYTYCYGTNITINVYNESNPSQSLTFNTFITNSSGSETYYHTSCTNPFVINMSDSPKGDSTSFTISSTGYYPRTFIIDIDPTISYILNVYLAPVNNAYIYCLIVINEYDEPVDDVKIVIKKYINTTNSFENMTVLYTDGIGQVLVYLIPDTSYKVFLNKTGYYDRTDDYIPDPTYYGIGYPKYFKIHGLNYTQIPEYDNRTVTFNVIMLSNSSLYIWHNVSICGTNTVEIYIYEYLNYTASFNASYSYATCNYSFYHSPINISRMYSVYFYQNFTDSLDGDYFFVRTVMPLGSFLYNKSYLEDKVAAVYGVWGPGYVNMFLLFLPFVTIVSIVGYVDKGLGAIGGGLYLAFANSRIQGLNLINIYEIAAFCVAIGFLLFLVYWRRGKT